MAGDRRSSRLNIQKRAARNGGCGDSTRIFSTTPSSPHGEVDTQTADKDRASDGGAGMTAQMLPFDDRGGISRAQPERRAGADAAWMHAMHGSHPTFADLVAGRVDAEIVAEDEGHVAFLAPAPFRPGHVVVATRRVVPYLYDLPEDEHARLWSFVRRVALVQKERLGCERVCTSVVGWVVRHVHVHLVPTDAEGQHPGLPGTPADREELRRLGRILRGETVK